MAPLYTADMTSPSSRAEAFCRRFGLTLPILQAPMAGVNSVALSAAVANEGVMGVFPADYVRRLKAKNIAWFACATTLSEARAAEEAGADAIVAQGFEAGGHRGAFTASHAEAQSIGLV